MLSLNRGARLKTIIGEPFVKMEINHLSKSLEADYCPAILSNNHQSLEFNTS